MANEKPKIGSISLRNGKASIVVDADGSTEDFCIDFVCQRMKRAVRGLPLTAYPRMVHSMVRDLRARGYAAIKDVQAQLKLMQADRRQGVRDLAKTWYGWLNTINMFRNVKTGAKQKSADALFYENADKIFQKVA